MQVLKMSFSLKKTIKTEKKKIKAKIVQVKLAFKNRPHRMSLRHDGGISFMGVEQLF